MKRSMALVFLLPLLYACSDPVDPVGEPSVLFAKGGNGGNGGNKGGGSDGGSGGEVNATWTIPTSAGLAFRGDGAGDYRHGECSVSTRIFTDGSESGDATIRTDRPKGKACGRTFTIVYSDGDSETLRAFANLRAIASIPIGETHSRAFVINPGALANNPSRCGRLIFGEIAGSPGSAASDMVSVRRVDASTWNVVSDGGHAAYCEGEDRLFAPMSISLTIVASADLP